MYTQHDRTDRQQKSNHNRYRQLPKNLLSTMPKRRLTSPLSTLIIQRYHNNNRQYFHHSTNRKSQRPNNNTNQKQQSHQRQSQSIIEGIQARQQHTIRLLQRQNMRRRQHTTLKHSPTNYSRNRRADHQ